MLTNCISWYIIDNLGIESESPEESKEMNINMDDKLMKFFCSRKKNERIPDRYKNLIVLDMKQNNLSIAQASKKYFLSSTTLRFIINEVEDYKTFANSVIERRKYRKIEQHHVQNEIKMQVQLSKEGISAKKIQQVIKKKLNVKISLCSIRRYLREGLSLSYKKGWKRRMDIDQTRLKHLRVLYTIRLTKMINQDTLLINIDETSLSNEVLSNYSWLKKGENWELFNEKFWGSLSLILAITSNGDYIGATVLKSLDSNIFVSFLMMTIDWILLKPDYRGRKIVFILDNCPVHRSKVSKKFMEDSNYDYMFLPAYSPTLAPIELVFALMKQEMKNWETSKIIKWKSKYGTKLINSSLASIHSCKIVRCWCHVWGVSFKYLDDYEAILKQNKLI